MSRQIQLTELGAVIPYGICIDDEDCLWVASKGGLFRINDKGETLFAEKHDRPRSMNAFSTVSYAKPSDNGQAVIFTKFADVNSMDETHLVLHGLDGQRTASNIIDGTVKSATMTTNGDIILTILKKDGTNEILKSNVDDFYTLTPLVSSDEFHFQHITASLEHNLIAVSCAKERVNPYSVQEIHLYDYNNGKFLRKFGDVNGKERGQFWCPRGLTFDIDGNLLILDKTGRIQKFSTVDGQYLTEVASMPAGLVNGFCLNEKKKLIYLTCSGLIEEIVDNKTEIICNDWIEVLDIKG